MHGLFAVWLLAAPVAAELEAELSSAPVAALSEEGAEPERSFSVSVADTEVFRLRADAGNRSAEERARQASKALATFARELELPSVTILREGAVLVVYANQTPIVRLSEADAELAGSDSLDTHASEIARDIEKALQAEHKRSRIANNVFSMSLVVFFGLIAFYLMRRVGTLTTRAHAWIENNGEKLTIRVRDVELIRTEMVQSASLVVLGIVRFLGHGALLYVWLVVSLSLFAATRGYTEKLTGIVLSPLSGLMTRIATTLPVLIVASIAALSVFVLVRFVGLLFAGVAKHETTLAWVPPDLAIPTSMLLRAGIIVAALIFAAPVVTGDPEGAFPRVGFVMLAAVALSAVPLLASALVGTVTLFGRRLRLDEWIEVGGIEGRVITLDLFELRLRTDRGEARIPMLSLLRHPLRKLGRTPRVVVRVTVATDTHPEACERALERAATPLAQNVKVEIESADRTGFVYAVSGEVETPSHRGRLLSALIQELQHEGIALGRRSWEQER